MATTQREEADALGQETRLHLEQEQAKKRLRDLIEEGLASGPGRRLTKADWKKLLAIARGEIDFST